MTNDLVKIRPSLLEHEKVKEALNPQCSHRFSFLIFFFFFFPSNLYFYPSQISQSDSLVCDASGISGTVTCPSPGNLTQTTALLRFQWQGYVPANHWACPFRCSQSPVTISIKGNDVEWVTSSSGPRQLPSRLESPTVWLPMWNAQFSYHNSGVLGFLFPCFISGLLS